jgi:hypothetical protein
MRKKLKIPFLKSKKKSLIPTDEDLVAAREQVKEYPLMLTSTHIQTLLNNKFIIENGAQLQPAKFLNEVAAYIEKGEVKSKEEFMVYMERTLAAIPPPPKVKKRFRLFPILHKKS